MRDPDLYKLLDVRRGVRDDEAKVIRVYPSEKFVPLGIEVAPPVSETCPRCHRPVNRFKWYWYYEATGQRWNAFIYRLLNR